MTGLEKSIHEVWRLRFKVVRHVKVTGRRGTLSQAKNAINILWDTVLLSDNLELSGGHTVFESLKTNLILHRLASQVDHSAILNAFNDWAALKIVRRSVWVVSISKTVFAVSTFYEQLIGASIIQDFHLLATFADKEGARVQPLVTIDNLLLDTIELLAQAVILATILGVWLHF